MLYLVTLTRDEGKPLIAGVGTALLDVVVMSLLPVLWYYTVPSPMEGGRMTMGLGLLTARRIVERHGGVLSVTSGGGVGSGFTVALRLNRARASERRA
jgi:nitrogen-specific signal transduction histidine kinase